MTIFILNIIIFTGCSESEVNNQLKNICEDNGFIIERYAVGSDNTVTYLVKNDANDCDIKITCNSDSVVELIEIEKNITSIHGKMDYDDDIITFVSEIANQYGSREYKKNEFKEFLSEGTEEEYSYREDMIFERFGENKYYSLMSVDSYAKNYKEGDSLLERYVINID